MRSTRLGWVLLSLTLLVVLGFSLAETPTAAGGPVWQYDALVVGVPFEDVGTTANAGFVDVLPGSSAGLTDRHHLVLHQDHPGVQDQNETNDRFGYTLASGDFNGDGYPDLAVGVPYEDVSIFLVGSFRTFEDAGIVQVFYGAAGGWGNNEVFGTSLLDVAQDTRYGSSLAVGDFNGDGYDDLAVGIPRRTVSDQPRAGAVRVLYGSRNGIRLQGSQLLTQGTTFSDTAPEAEDQFGRALSAGDFDGDGYDDLAIGVPFEDTPQGADVGIVNVIYGSRTGLTSGRTQTWWQGRNDINALAEAGDLFGYALTTGDFNGDGYDDLAIGVPWEDIGSTRNAGTVNVIYGSRRGLSARGHQGWYQGLGTIQGAAEADDAFGQALTSGDFNGDGYDDLAVGVPYEDLGAVQNAGAVAVIYGHVSGLRDTGNQLWHQDSPGIIGLVEADDRFGITLASGDFNGDGYADLAIGVPREDIDGQQDAGGVNVIYGAAGGLRARGNQGWDQQRLPGVAPERGDQFGWALTVLKAAGGPAHRHYFPFVWKVQR